MKEAYQLMRHRDPKLTLERYARTRVDRLAQLAEAIGNTLCPPENTKSTQRAILKKAAGAENCCVPTTSDSGKVVEAGGIEPPSRGVSTKASTHVDYRLSCRPTRLR